MLSSLLHSSTPGCVFKHHHQNCRSASATSTLYHDRRQACCLGVCMCVACPIIDCLPMMFKDQVMTPRCAAGLPQMTYTGGYSQSTLILTMATSLALLDHGVKVLSSASSSVRPSALASLSVCSELHDVAIIMCVCPCANFHVLNVRFRQTAAITAPAA